MPRVLVERIDSPLHVNLRSRHHLAPSLSSRPPAVAVAKDRPTYGTGTPDVVLEAPTGREEEVYVCRGCKTHLCTSRDVVSHHFHGKHGKAFLTRSCANSYFGPSEQKMLMTGLHIVRNVYCGGVGGNVVGLSDHADVAVEEMQLQRLARDIRATHSPPPVTNTTITTNIAHHPPYSNNPRARGGVPSRHSGGSNSRAEDNDADAATATERFVNAVPATPCGRLLGWTYDYAHEKQQLYKMAKYVIEQEHVETMW